MDMTSIITLLFIGFIGSFISGMLGIGGSIINYPMLMLIPPLVSVLMYTPHQVSGIIAVQALFSSFAGAWVYRKSGYLNKKLIIYMGMAILIGSLAGSYTSAFVSESYINVVYGILAIIAAVLMLLPKHNDDELSSSSSMEDHTNYWLAAVLACIVGIVSGIVGAAGGFILLPIMMVVLKIPTRITIATSLAVTFISSIGGTIGKIVTNQVLIDPALIIMVVSLIAAPVGAKAGKKLNVKLLQLILATLILATAIKIWFEVLS